MLTHSELAVHTLNSNNQNNFDLKCYQSQHPLNCDSADEQEKQNKMHSINAAAPSPKIVSARNAADKIRFYDCDIIFLSALLFNKFFVSNWEKHASLPSEKAVFSSLQDNVSSDEEEEDSEDEDNDIDNLDENYKNLNEKSQKGIDWNKKDFEGLLNWLLRVNKDSAEQLQQMASLQQNAMNVLTQQDDIIMADEIEKLKNVEEVEERLINVLTETAEMIIGMLMFYAYFI